MFSIQCLHELKTRNKTINDDNNIFIMFFDWIRNVYQVMTNWMIFRRYDEDVDEYFADEPKLLLLTQSVANLSTFEREQPQQQRSKEI